MSSFKIVCSPHLFFFLIRNIFKINSCNQTKPLWSKLQEVLNSEILLPKNTPQSGFLGFPNNKENFEIINHFHRIFKYYLFKVRDTRKI